jgi:hypothetical protein
MTEEIMIIITGILSARKTSNEADMPMVAKRIFEIFFVIENGSKV